MLTRLMNWHLDFETRSHVSLPDVGAWRYAQDPSTEIICMGFGARKEDIETINGLEIGFDWAWEAWKKHPKITAMVMSHIVAQNAPFEYAVYNLILHRRFGWPARWDPALWGCTLARAAQCGLPLDLDNMAKALKLPVQKDMEGRRVMQQLCRPRADGTWDEDPDKFKRLAVYCGIDVSTEMCADEALPPLVPFERRIWEHDLVSNRRGVAVDLDLAGKAGGFAERITNNLNARLLRLTGGGVTKASRIAEIKHWIGAQGHPEYMGEAPESLDKVNLFKLLTRADVSERVKEVVRIRQQVGKSSTAKYAKTLEAAGSDGRVRGVLQYHAAHTGRWGGRLIQPQNYPHGFKPEPQAEAVSFILRNDYHGFTEKYADKAMAALADVLRGTIVAAPGKVLVAADLSAIEPCVLMTLAGEAETREQLRRKEKPYMPLARDIYRNPKLTKEKNQTEYDIGKRVFLGCGYGLGAKSFQIRTFEETAKLGTPLWIEDELAKTAVDTYRNKYPGVPRLWREVEAAAIAAVQRPGTNYSSCGGRVIWGMSKDRRFLVAKLPSGRYLWYYKPELRLVDTPWGEKKVAMCYWGKDPVTKQWRLVKTYGGLLVENVVQAIARDILVCGMLAVEAIGSWIHAILTVHDEVVGEADDPGQKAWPALLEKFVNAMTRGLPEWTQEFPVNADGWVGYRYHKE